MFIIKGVGRGEIDWITLGRSEVSPEGYTDRDPTHEILHNRNPKSIISTVNPLIKGKDISSISNPWNIWVDSYNAYEPTRP